MKTSFFTIDFTTSLGPIRGRVAVDTAPMGLAHLVPTALELTSLLVARACRREEQEGRHISCGPGCGVCCSQMVPLSPPEALYLADLIASLPPPLRQAVVERFEGIEGALRKRGMINQLMSPDYTDDEVFPVAKEYFYLGMSCPFLVNESCSIHASRPVACREYNVTSPSSWCEDPYRHSIVKVPMPLLLSAPLARLTASLTGDKPRLIPLVLAPLWVSQHEDLRQRQWPGVDLFEAFMKQVGPQPHEISESRCVEEKRRHK